MRRNVFGLACVVGLVSGGAWGAELLVNGGFEDQPNFGSGTVWNQSGYSVFTGAEIPGWTIEPGHAVTIHNALVYPHIDGYSVNTDGEGFNGNNCDLYQDVLADPSWGLVLKYQHVGWYQDPVTATVTVTDLGSLEVLYSKTFGWTAEPVTEMGSFSGGSVRIRITSTNHGSAPTNDNVMILDNFSLQSIPEPEWVGGLVVMGAMMGRRRGRSGEKGG